jgi:NarL family two-component system response regulator LiaR
MTESQTQRRRKSLMTIRVLLVDDHAVVRAGLRALLQEAPDLDVVGEVGCGSDAVTLARKLRPDVLVTDLLLSDLDGLTVTRTIRSELPDTQVVMLTSGTDDESAVVHAVRAGAIGYLSKWADTDMLIQTIRAAANGRVELSPRATARLVQELRSPTNDSPLTDREQEVLREVGVGRTNKEIARSLDIAETTVKSHVSAILDKLGVRSRTQAALHAMRSDRRAA